MKEGETDVVWTREETRQRIGGKKYSGKCTTWEKTKRKTELEMDGLCQQRYERYGWTKRSP